MTLDHVKAHELTTQLITRYKNQQKILALLNCGSESDVHMDDFQMYASTYSAALSLTKKMSAK